MCIFAFPNLVIALIHFLDIISGKTITPAPGLTARVPHHPHLTAVLAAFPPAFHSSIRFQAQQAIFVHDVNYLRICTAGSGRRWAEIRRTTELLTLNIVPNSSTAEAADRHRAGRRGWRKKGEEDIGHQY
ncbi:hypothetical protein LXA43DRAFT_412698 [Ganoderma leucocontextum]|nr:hypothetical protein LXA43DRAFT_412698 [Ganoderma leucocontextum]